MDYIIEVNEKHPEIEPIASQVARSGLPADLVEIANGRNIVGYLNTPIGKVNIKSFGRPGFVKGVIYTYLRPSKARRSYEYAHQLIELGFLTPEPLAFIEAKKSGLLSESYYFSRQADAKEFRYVEERPDEKPLLQALGCELARLHKAGVWMRDFSPGNILFYPDSSAPDGYRFMYVDLNRMSFNIHKPTKLNTMFRSIVVHPYQVELIARSYAEVMQLPEDEVVKTALEIHRKFQNFLARKRKIKSRLKKNR